MNPKLMADKLEEYEQFAYKHGFGDYWLSDVGENLKFYMLTCHNEGKKPTLEGLMKWMEDLHIKASK